jgi:hypothetical protein
MTLRGFLSAFLVMAPFTLSQVWTLDSVYRDPQHGLSFRYPGRWQANTHFAQLQPVLTQSDDTRPLAAFSYSEGGFPRARVVGPYSGTNLEGFGIAYTVVPASGTSACNAKAASLSGAQKSEPVVLGGRSFSAYATGDAGMSQSISGHLYATYAMDRCFLLETDVAVVAPGVAEGARTLTPEQQQAIEDGLLSIVRSVKIGPVPAH